MKTKNRKVEIIVFIIVIVIICFVLIAATVDEDAYDSSYIENDLEGAIIDGKVFDVNTYKENNTLSLRPIYLSEFCFSENLEGLGNYALYVYLYNPQNLHIQINSRLNKIQIANEYNALGDPVNYKKYNLLYCTRTKNNLLYKFKIEDPKNEILNRIIKDIKYFNGRRYDISGVEIQETGMHNAKEYYMGASYLYKGYAKGYGSNNKESTLDISVKDLQTLELNVNCTNYLTGISSTGAYHRDNINSVYFSVPNYILNNYGYLDKIDAEWWEYQLNPIIVTSNDVFYDALKENIKTNITNKQLDYCLFYGYEGIKTSSPETILLPNGQIIQVKGPNEKWMYDWAYGIESKTGEKMDGGCYVQEVKNTSNILPFAFHSNKISEEGIFAYLNKKTVAGNVDSDILTQYIYEYCDIYNNVLPSELITNELDCVRKNNKKLKLGYNNIIASLSDTYSLSSYKSNHSLFERLNDYGFTRPDNINYDPIQFNVIQKVDKQSLDASTYDDLLVNIEDMDSFKEFCNASYLNDESPFIFRFAVSDYYTRPLGRLSNNKAFEDCDEKDSDTYYAQQTIFLNFDIIKLTFSKNGNYTIIPAVSSPQDIIAGIIPPPIEYSTIDLGIGKIKNTFNDLGNNISRWWQNSKNILMPIIIVLVIILMLLLSLLIYRIINKLIQKRDKDTISIEIVNNETTSNNDLSAEDSVKSDKKKKKKHIAHN